MNNPKKFLNTSEINIRPAPNKSWWVNYNNKVMFATEVDEITLLLHSNSKLFSKENNFKPSDRKDWFEKEVLIDEVTFFNYK